MNPRIHSIKNRSFLERFPSARVTIRFETVFLASALTVIFAVAATLVSVPAIRGDEKQPSCPWTSAQTVKPAEFAQELENRNRTPPTIVYVGFRTLFAGGHIPSVLFHGSASTGQGLPDLKDWGAAPPRSRNLVTDSGCCASE